MGLEEGKEFVEGPPIMGAQEKHELFMTKGIPLGENSISDIRRFFSEGERPLEEREFILFWQSLTEQEKDEFRNAILT
jgi:hypothetical protein